MNISNKYAFIDVEMERREELFQRRSIQSVNPTVGMGIEVCGSNMINFCSNDYMGLSKHPKLQERAVEYMTRYGSGSTASRLVCGTYDCCRQVEKKIARLKQTESSLIFNSGYQANVSVLPALCDRNSLILSDSLNHSSLIRGILSARCRKIRFQHNDMSDLRRLLQENVDLGYSRIIIVTESVFGMDGDRSDIDVLVNLAEDFSAILIVDEAHATGVLGEQGMGLTCGKKVDVIIGTFGKALGSFGAYVACSKKISEYLTNCCTGFVYSTALPPSVIGCIDAALDLIPQMEEERVTLHMKANFLRSSLQELGWQTGFSTTQIVPLIIGEEKKTLAISKWFETRGIFAKAIRPPTVEDGKARVRLTLSALHSWEQVEKLVDVATEWRLNGE